MHICDDSAACTTDCETQIATTVAESAEELEADIGHMSSVNHGQLASDLEACLLGYLFEPAGIVDYLPNYLVFKVNLYKGYVDAENREDFFGSVRNGRRAGFFEKLPQYP